MEYGSALRTLLCSNNCVKLKRHSFRQPILYQPRLPDPFEDRNLNLYHIQHLGEGPES